MDLPPHFRTDSESIDDAIDLAYDALHDVAAFVEVERLMGNGAAIRRPSAQMLAASFAAGAIACLLILFTMGVI